MYNSQRVADILTVYDLYDPYKDDRSPRYKALVSTSISDSILDNNETKNDISANCWISSLSLSRPIGAVLIPAIAGAWTVRFGMFGWAEQDMRGGVIKIEADGSMFGGDSNLVYRGRLTASGSGVVGSLAIERHGADPEFRNSFGTNEQHYEMAFNVEPISSDRLEGYMQRAGHPDMHISMMRLH